jgi:ABC-type transport system involved in multi-copper enzyme maturation permease subunit
MLMTIIKKEILTNLLSFRFAVSLVLCMVLIPMSTYVLKDDYKQELSDYHGRVALYEEHVRQVSSINNIDPMYDKAPAVLSVMFKKGAANRLIEDSNVGIYYGNDTSNPIPILLPLFDMGAVLGVILSLMAILFGYDAFVSEKEGGTLKLVLSNSVPRSQVLLGKWIGGYVCLILPLVLSTIISLMIVLIDPLVSLRGSDWLALGLIFLGAFIYISIFFTLAYFISAISRSFAASALISLCVWLFIVLIAPNASIYVAGKLRPMPSIQKFQHEMQEANMKLNQEEGKELDAFMSKPHTEEEEARFLKESLAEDGAFSTVVRGVIAEGKRLRSEFDQKANAQVNLARQISAISPYACFTYLASSLSGTGVEAERDLSQKGVRFFPEFIGYILDKIKQNARTFADIGKKMDTSDMPRFKYVELGVSERLSDSLIYFLLLVIFNVVFFMASYVAFLRSGVR